MGVAGSVTSAVSGTSVTLPDKGLTIIGASVRAHTVAGYLSIPIDGSRNGIILFSSNGPITAVANNTPLGIMQKNGIQAFHFTTSGTVLNYTGTGLSSGTFVFYYGTPFSGSVPLNALSGVASAVVTTDATEVFTFSSGVKLTGISFVPSGDPGQTQEQYSVSWASGAGRTVDVSFTEGSLVEVIPLDDIPSASSLTLTATHTGTNVGTGYLVLYYKF